MRYTKAFICPPLNPDQQPINFKPIASLAQQCNNDNWIVIRHALATTRRREMHFPFKITVRLKYCARIFIFCGLCIHNAVAQTSAPFFLPGSPQQRDEPLTPTIQNTPIPLTIQQPTPDITPHPLPVLTQDSSPALQPLTTDNGFFLPVPQMTPAAQADHTPIKQETSTTNSQSETANPLQTAQQPITNQQQNNLWQNTEHGEQKQQLYFARGSDLIKPSAPIIVWKDITPPAANSQYQILIDPTSIVPSPEHPRWRQATVQAKMQSDSYRQWKLTFSCKANAVRYDEIETVNQGVSVHENRPSIYFVSINNWPDQQWLRYAYHVACDE